MHLNVAQGASRTPQRRVACEVVSHDTIGVPRNIRTP